jgi:hypothetical protein
MKLPADRKEKTKVLVLIGLGVLAIVSVTTQGMVGLTAHKRTIAVELEDLKFQTQTARRDVLQAEGLRPRNAEAIARVMKASNSYVLHPILGNYRLGATEFLQRLAAESGVELTGLQEVGIMDLPRAGEGKGKSAFKAYTARASIECDYFTLLAFLHRLERANPLLCLATLSVASQGEKIPDKHRATLGVQWPIWADEAMVETMRTRASDAGLGQGGS